MIWKGPATEDPDREAFQQYLIDRLSRAGCWEYGTAEMRNEAAAALAEIWSRDLHRRPVPEGWVALLGARVFWGLRERRVALRLLEVWAGVPAAPWYAPLIGRGGPCLAAAWVLGMGNLHPAMTSLHPSGAGWRVDLDRLGGGPAGRMELVRWTRLRRVVEQGAEIWDGTDGRGVLVVRGREREIPRAWLGEVLYRTGQHRGWGYVPDVVRSPVVPG
jgi:hypothetical protein